MEKTRFYILALLVTFMGLAVSSCSKDDDNISPIVGTWEKTTESSAVGQFVFNSDNTGSYSLTRDGRMVTYFFDYKYDQSNSKITIIFADGSGMTGTANFYGNYLHLTLDYVTKGSLEITLKKK